MVRRHGRNEPLEEAPPSPAARDAVQLGQDALQRGVPGQLLARAFPCGPDSVAGATDGGTAAVMLGRAQQGRVSTRRGRPRSRLKRAGSSRRLQQAHRRGVSFHQACRRGLRLHQGAGSLRGAGRGRSLQQLRGPELAVRLPPVRIRKGRRSSASGSPGSATVDSTHESSSPRSAASGP